jgi:hypothetical protein
VLLPLSAHRSSIRVRHEPTEMATGLPSIAAGTRAQATPAAVAVRVTVPRIAGDVTAGSAPLPVSYALCAERRRLLICSGAAIRRDCLMGVQLGFMGVQLGEVIGPVCGAQTSGSS